MKRRASIPIVLVLMFFQLMASNMVHPVTPTFFKDLSMPTLTCSALPLRLWRSHNPCSVRSGAVWATVWAECGYWSSPLGYVVGQLAFLLSGSVPTILLARMLSGLFAAGTTVNFMAYIADVSPAGQLGRNMSVCAAVTSAGTAAGYLVGGVIGDLSVHGTFLAQIAILLHGGRRNRPAAPGRPCLSKAAAGPEKGGKPLFCIPGSPRAAHAQGLRIPVCGVCLPALQPPPMTILSIIILRINSGFPPSYNGLIYAVVGPIGLIVNFTLGLRIQRRKLLGPIGHHPRAQRIHAAFFLALSQIAPFIALNMLFYVFSSMYLPLQQALIIREGKEETDRFPEYFPPCGRWV